MKLSELKSLLSALPTIAFELPDGSLVPSHFHVTEVGLVLKTFIDCGGKIRKEEKISLQLWEADDYDHRLHPEKLLHILELSERALELQDLEIEVEYQGTTIGKYALGFVTPNFILIPTQTTCLAMDACLPPAPKVKRSLRSLGAERQSCCTPESGCC